MGVYKKLKKHIQQFTPKYLYSVIITTYRFLNPFVSSLIVYPHKDHWRVISIEGAKSKEVRCIPNRIQTMRGKKSIQDKKVKRYTRQNFVYIESEDVVLDIGSFVGEFAIPASERSKRVICIEPDTQNFNCLEDNVYNIENITAYNILGWKTEENVKFKVGMDASDHSIINIDSKNKKNTVTR
jgi:hypothetical protein